MKRIFILFLFSIIVRIGFSQEVSIGAGYSKYFVYHANSSSINGFNFSLDFSINDRVGFYTDFIRYFEVTNGFQTYKLWGLDLNAYYNVTNEERWQVYGIGGVSYERESFLYNTTLVILTGPKQTQNNNFHLNFGAGSCHKIFDNIWVDLKINVNSIWLFRINPSIIYRFGS